MCFKQHGIGLDVKRDQEMFIQTIRTGLKMTNWAVNGFRWSLRRENSVSITGRFDFFFPGRVKIKPVPQSRFITISIHLHINSMWFLRSKLSQFHRKWHFLCFLSSGCVQLLPSEVHQRFRLSEMVRCGESRGKNPLRETTAHHAQQNMGESFQPSQTLNFNSLLLSLLILQTLISFLHNFISNTFRKKH